MGQAYRELGDMDKAEDYFKQAIAADPKNPEFQLNMGVLYHKYREQPKAALPYYAAYFENGGSDSRVADWIRECGGTPPGPK